MTPLSSNKSLSGRLAQFLKSAVLPEDYPDEMRPEVALVGRSNAGKSTLLNSMCGGKKIAHVSNTPGKTRLLNFFDVGDFYRLVDLPGYGFAARNPSERHMWDKMIQDFFKLRPNLVGFLLICDIRREWTKDEELLWQWAQARGLKAVCVLTKSDKLNRAEKERALQRWLKTSHLEKDAFHGTSALKNDGVSTLEDYIFKSWVKPYLNQTS